MVEVDTTLGKCKEAQRAGLFEKAQGLVDLLSFLQHCALRLGLADALRASQVHQVQLGDNELVPLCTCAALQHDAEDGVGAGGLPVELVLCHHTVALSLRNSCGLHDRSVRNIYTA